MILVARSHRWRAWTAHFGGDEGFVLSLIFHFGNDLMHTQLILRLRVGDLSDFP